jgi:PAS domain S-box-containing protein
VSVLSTSGEQRRAVSILLAAGLIGAATYWYFASHTRTIPRRVLRIGFENAPPVQVRTGSGFGGLAVDTVREAAKRAGISLQWIETGTSSEEAFRRGLVDLWPIMADLPDRHKRVHITRPYLHTTHTLVLLEGSAAPDRTFSGQIALSKMPLHVRLASGAFPKAQLVQFQDISTILKDICLGTVTAAFLEDRTAMAALREKPSECGSQPLRVEPLPGLTLQLGVASTFQAAGAADEIRAEIGGLFRDGTLAATIAKYSYYGLDDTWTTYALLQAAERERWIAWGVGGLGLLVALTLWRATALRQRKRSLAAIRESDERFRRVFEEGPLGLGLVGKDCRYLKVNTALCQMVGYSQAELEEKSFVDITYSDDVKADMELAKRLFRGEIPFYRMTKRYVKKSGEIVWANLTASLVHDVKGAPIYGLAMVEDITETRRAQEEMLRRQKLESLGVLAGGIAHDFNNLLGGILAQAELIESDLPAGFPSQEVEMIKTSVIRGSEIVRQLMIYSGRETGNFDQVDISLLAEEMLELLKISISKHSILKTDLGKNLPLLRGHAPQIRQIVMNLIMNASEAIGDTDGVIQVTTSHIIGGPTLASNTLMRLAEGDYIRLEVSDTGCGMTEEVKARIFDPFFSTKSGGRGLGLTVVQGMVRAHGGGIDLVSEPGQGTTFQVFLPCSCEPVGGGHGVIPSVGEERANANANAGTILVVEDEEVLRLAISKALRKKGLSVIEASNGSVAMDLVRSQMADLDAIFLDATLPGRSSREILEEAHRIRPDLKVIVTSAYCKEEVDASFRGLRVERFVQKPFQLDDILRFLAIPTGQAN